MTGVFSPQGHVLEHQGEVSSGARLLVHGVVATQILSFISQRKDLSTDKAQLVRNSPHMACETKTV